MSSPVSVDASAASLVRIRENLSRAIVGKDAELDLLIAGLVSGGHVLLEDIPGVGKTTLAKALARSVGADFTRIQFTPDLLPTDIVGASIYNPQDGVFHFNPGPVFTNILLADELNRASPRTQSALLEAMGEKQVTVDGDSRALSSPFLVIATQNPIDTQGTYPLPEAQLDRFAMQLSLGYPPSSEERRILLGEGGASRLDELEAVLSPEGLVELQQAAAGLSIEDSVADYLLALVNATRSHPSVELGVSPRGALSLLGLAKAAALGQGRAHVSPDDVKRMARPCLAHRLVLSSKAKYAGLQKLTVIDELLHSLDVPR